MNWKKRWSDQCKKEKTGSVLVQSLTTCNSKSCLDWDCQFVNDKQTWRVIDIKNNDSDEFCELILFVVYLNESM